MKRWDLRPIEIRNLFNPAFCGLILFRALRGYEEEDPRGMPFSLSLVVLPLCLQREARETLAQANRSYFLKIVAANPQMLVDFSKRTTDLLPFAFEALGFLMHLGVISVSEDGRLTTTPEGVKKTIDGTPETVSCQRVARFLGREFARIGDRATVYSTLGIRP
ncbi:three component ABC system middle component [Brevundimonas sp.]|uniref:three component ABC system middle component n=1 Tax=Brevundimonas sp. TaxID=1871086 RepID=UPI0018374E56|nr:three component ABC system middle component [Brevundimonas sp.]MBA4806215.1 hypothetical protein [Brevundimonas sp.]